MYRDRWLFRGTGRTSGETDGPKEWRKRERKRIVRMHIRTSGNLIYTTRKYRAILANGRFSRCSHLGSLLYSHETASALVTPDWPVRVKRRLNCIQNNVHVRSYAIAGTHSVSPSLPGSRQGRTKIRLTKWFSRICIPVTPGVANRHVVASSIRFKPSGIHPRR